MVISISLSTNHSPIARRVQLAPRTGEELREDIFPEMLARAVG